MSNEEIVNNIQNGIDVTRNQELLWENNCSFVRMIVKECVGSNCNKMDMEDYMQQGFLGLISAVSKYKPDKNTKFLTLAKYYIRVAVFRYNGYNTSTINIPDYVKLQMRRLEQFKREFHEQFKREPSEHDIQEALGLSIVAIRSTEKYLLNVRTRSLDEYVNDDGSMSLAEILSSDENIENLIGSSEYQKQLHEVLNKALSELDEKTRLMIIKRYYTEDSLKEIGKIFACSRQTVAERIEKGFYKIIHGQYCGELEGFMWDGYKASPKLWSDYVDTEEIDSIECDLLIAEDI